MSAWFATNKTILLIVLIVLMLGGILWYRHNLIAEGEQRIKDADANALGVARAETKADEIKLNQRAIDAENAHVNVQNQFDQYRAEHPIAPVLMCRANHRDAGVPAGSATHGADAGSAAAAAGVSAVSGGGASEVVDIAPELNTIVHVAGELALGLSRWQEHPRQPNSIGGP